MDKKTITQIFKRFYRDNPHPTTELIYNNNFELLIAVILSAQATDKSVNLVTQKLFKIANTPDAILHLGEAKLKTYIRSIGLYRTKAKNIITCCQKLITQFNRTIPSTRSELESLPGVGRKTANVILNTCFGEPTIAVDTHIFRVANRIGLAHATTRLATELQLLAVIPDQFKVKAHHYLILHGRYICTARKPKCPQCIINDLCEYAYKTPSA